MGSFLSEHVARGANSRPIRPQFDRFLAVVDCVLQVVLFRVRCAAIAVENGVLRIDFDRFRVAFDRLVEIARFERFVPLLLELFGCRLQTGVD